MRETRQDQTGQPKTAQDMRAARLKAALKANIAKRKAQARARHTKDEPPKNEKA